MSAIKSVAVNTKTKRMLVWYDPQVEKLVKTSKVIPYNGRNVIAMPHGETEARLLRNLGYEVPSTFSQYYIWGRTKPFDHQIVTADLVATHPRCFVLSDPGTGKTRSVIAAFDWLLETGAISNVLIICPLSIMESVWVQELFKWAPNLTSTVLHAARDQRRELAKENTDVHIINYDGPKFIEQELAANQYDMIILDESTAVKNVTTERWKSIKRLCKPEVRVVAMTGTPTPQSPMDAHGQILMVTGNKLLKSKIWFRGMVMNQVRPYVWHPKPDARKIIHRLMQPAVRYRSIDCLTLPDMVQEVRKVPLTKEQQTVYDKMKRDMITRLQSGEEITAANAGVMLSKLIQISAGFIYDAAGEGIPLDARPRLRELEAAVNSVDHKVIIFSNFKYSVSYISDYLRAHGHKVATVTGDTPSKDRQQIFNNFQNGSHLDVLIAHPKVAAHGLTLTAANAVIWYDLPNSYEQFYQANHRIHRPGQQNKHYIICLLSTEMDVKVYKRLCDRKSAQDLLLELYQR